jgi:hypothetical protein
MMSRVTSVLEATSGGTTADDFSLGPADTNASASFSLNRLLRDYKDDRAREDAAACAEEAWAAGSSARTGARAAQLPLVALSMQALIPGSLAALALGPPPASTSPQGGNTESLVVPGLYGMTLTANALSPRSSRSGDGRDTAAAATTMAAVVAASPEPESFSWVDRPAAALPVDDASMPILAPQAAAGSNAGTTPRRSSQRSVHAAAYLQAQLSPPARGNGADVAGGTRHANSDNNVAASAGSSSDDSIKRLLSLSVMMLRTGSGGH